MKKIWFLLVLIASIPLLALAADKTIHQLTAGGTPRTGDVIPIDRASGLSWANYSITAGDLQSWISGNVSSWTTNIYVTNLYSSSSYTLNSYTTNLYATTEYVTNLYATTENVTNLYVNNEYVTNLYAITEYVTNLYATTEYVTNLYSTTNFNDYSYITNLYVTTNYADYTYTTNLYVSNAYITNLYVTTNYMDVSYITNLTVSNLYVTNITARNLTVQNFYSTANYLDQLTITNQIMWVTNTWPGPTNVINIGGPYDQNYATVVPCSITGFTNKPSYTTSEVLLSIYNTSASNITVTLPANVADGDYTLTHTVTNGTCGYLWLRYTPVGPRTNCVFRNM